MTKPKTGATAPVEEQQPDVVAVPKTEEWPTQGGSYIRNPDGSLTREEEA